MKSSWCSLFRLDQRHVYSIAFVLLPLLVLFGCTTFDMQIDALSDPNAFTGRKVFIFPGDPGINPNDLLFREFGKQVEIALGRRGFEIVADISEADQIVFLLYGITDPQRRTVAIPQFGPTSIQSASTIGRATVQSNQIIGSSTTTYNYEYGITGYVPVERTTYTRMVLLSSYDWQHFATTEQLKPIWRVAIESTGRSGDLRLVFPYMIAAAESHIGANTQRTITVQIHEYSTAAEPYRNVQ